MTALVVLYMVNQLLLPGHVEHIGGFSAFRVALESVVGPLSTQALASQIFGLYCGFVYFTPLLGGMIADRWIGQRNAVARGCRNSHSGAAISLDGRDLARLKSPIARRIMVAEASETPKSGERGDVVQTRIALTFFGGVSLAVYETGAAVEFFRLVTDRDGVYRKLRDRIGPVVVDVISGTSAGALSAAFLANALINRSRSLDPLMKLWLEKADLDTLFYSETETEATSLLNGKGFLDLIKEALTEMVGSEVASEPYQQYLDLFITATSLEGDVRKFKLDKDNIEARTHKRVFHFRYRGDECDIDEEKQNDFEPQRLHLLARAARASASFPGSF